MADVREGLTHGVALVLVVLAVVASHARPHFDPEAGRLRTFPTHFDEYVHWAYAEQALEEGTLAFHDPFTGSAPSAPKKHTPESGFHAYAGALQSVTGIPWTTFLQVFPLAVSAVLAIGVFLVARSWGAGFPAALWIAAIPTSLRFLGPGYFVPIAFALPLVVGAAFLILRSPSIGGMLAFAIIAAAIWPIHTMGGIVVLVMGAVQAVLLLRGHVPRAAALLALLIVPALMVLPDLVPSYSQKQAQLLPAGVEFVGQFGWLPLLLAALGVVVLTLRRETRTAGLVLGAALLVFEGIILRRLVTEEDPFRLYDRSILVVFLLASLLAGAGAMAVARALGSRGAARRFAPAFMAIALLLPVLGAGMSLAAQSKEPIYQVISEHEADRFEAAGVALAHVPGRALVEGLPTIPFSIITDRPTLHVVYPGDPVEPEFVRRFFAEGASDTLLLVATGTTVVVTDGAVRNPDLVRVADGVYVLRPDYVERMFPKADSS